MYEISKSFHFSASHKLEGLPLNHPCSRLHGHNYTVTVTLRGSQLNPSGFVVDYNQLDELKAYIDQYLDHRHLNDVLQFQTSAENIAKFLWEYCSQRWRETYSVSVKETDKTIATYWSDDE